MAWIAPLWTMSVEFEMWIWNEYESTFVVLTPVWFLVPKVWKLDNVLFKIYSVRTPDSQAFASPVRCITRPKYWFEPFALFLSSMAFFFFFVVLFLPIFAYFLPIFTIFIPRTGVDSCKFSQAFASMYVRGLGLASCCQNQNQSQFWTCKKFFFFLIFLMFFFF